jgi:hypothetical protein
MKPLDARPGMVVLDMFSTGGRGHPTGGHAAWRQEPAG